MEEGVVCGSLFFYLIDIKTNRNEKVDDVHRHVGRCDNNHGGATGGATL